MKRDGRHYEAYGLSIWSDLCLTGVPEGREGHVDVTIERGAVESPSPSQVPEGEGCWRGTEAEAWYYWESVGALHVGEGRAVTYQPAPGASELSVRLAVLGPGLATILHQRGHLVLHGSGIAVEGGAAIFVGHSGWGKSTVATALHLRGYSLIADDLIAVDLGPGGAPSVYTGPPELKLWDDSAAALKVQVDRLTPFGVGRESTKYAYHHETPFADKQAPVRGIYVLAPPTGGDVRLRSLPQAMAILHLMTHSYCSELLRLVGDEANFRQAARLVRGVPVRSVQRGASLGDVPVLADQIIADLRHGR